MTQGLLTIFHTKPNVGFPRERGTSWGLHAVDHCQTCPKGVCVCVQQENLALYGFQGEKEIMYSNSLDRKLKSFLSRKTSSFFFLSRKKKKKCCIKRPKMGLHGKSYQFCSIPWILLVTLTHPKHTGIEEFNKTKVFYSWTSPGFFSLNPFMASYWWRVTHPKPLVSLLHVAFSLWVVRLMALQML